jgi:hypothetical protein
MDIEIGSLTPKQYAETGLRAYIDAGYRRAIARVSTEDREFFSAEGFSLVGTTSANGEVHFSMAKALNADGAAIGQGVVARSQAGVVDRNEIPAPPAPSPPEEQRAAAAQIKRLAEFGEWVKESRDQASRPILKKDDFAVASNLAAVDPDAWDGAVQEYKDTLREALSQVCGLESSASPKRI